MIGIQAVTCSCISVHIDVFPICIRENVVLEVLIYEVVSVIMWSRITLFQQKGVLATVRDLLIFALGLTSGGLMVTVIMCLLDIIRL